MKLILEVDDDTAAQARAYVTRLRAERRRGAHVIMELPNAAEELGLLLKKALNTNQQQILIQQQQLFDRLDRMQERQARKIKA